MFTSSRYIHHPMHAADLHHIKHNGFSVQLRPAGYEFINGLHYMDDEPTDVDVRYTICNKKDQFSKKQARIELESKPYEKVEIHKLPEFLAKLELSMWRVSLPTSREYSNRWAWVWKYFI